MPTASELCNLYSKEKHLTDFIEETITNVELNARHGEKYTNVDVPNGLTRTDIELPLKNAFPECKVTWKWFIQSYRIRWA
jgi:hypothetical protein